MKVSNLKIGLIAVLLTLCCAVSMAADREVYLKHSSGLVAGRRADDGRAILISASKATAVKLKIRDVGSGYYLIVHTDADGTETYMTLNGSWNTYFESNAETDNAKYSIEGDADGVFLLKCKANSKYLGSDSNDDNASLFSDKGGTDVKHFWYFADNKNAPLPSTESSYIVAPNDRRQQNEGWGVSLCWWANMCGKWSDAKIDQIVDWLTSPTGLNFNIFRYNIGGGDDPENKNCTLHHMGNGKGLRAEMEGFKTASDQDYDWSKDAAQRKIMLKIKEKRPDAIFEAFSNSAPYYMTYSGCCAGNVDGGKDNLRPEYYEEFAHYLVDVCKHYKDEYGIEFKTLEPFNEPVTNFWHADGVQEGCHVDAKSQVKFLKVLAPILKESGLNTVISAADETNVGQAVWTFQQYQDDKILDLVGQYNTHTYGADNVSRSRIGSLARSNGITLWMSETGSGGSGIGGNLSVAQRMFDDIRYMLPTAWIDWQYIEENNDQWCLVRGKFSGQTYEKVKNFYVRQQVTRHIKQGYHFVSSLSPNTLAAVNEAGDTLVLVALNTSASAAKHHVVLAGSKIDGEITAYQTTASKNHSRSVSGIKAEGSTLDMNFPAESITTLLIPIKSSGDGDDEAVVEENVPYAIIPQYNTEVALTAKNNGVTINKMALSESADEECLMDKSQIWYFADAGKNQYTLTNGNGDILTGTSGYALSASNKKGANQAFAVEKVDGVFVKITCTSQNKSLDLSNESSAPSTQVGLWAYGNAVTAGHRNWYLMPVAKYDESTGIQSAAQKSDNVAPAYFTLSGIKTNAAQPGIYILKKGDGTTQKIIKK